MDPAASPKEGSRIADLARERWYVVNEKLTIRFPFLDMGIASTGKAAGWFVLWLSPRINELYGDQKN